MKYIEHAWGTEVGLSGEEAKTICRLGKGAECCAFLVADTNGFECIRISYPTNTIIFERLEKGIMNAKGEGEWEGCPWHKGKIESSAS